MAESDRLITIGVLARASGLTASALRFYDDCGLLVPARVDPLTGYRYYTEDQRDRATLIRRLRSIEVPLESIAEILTGDARRAERLLDRHVSELHRRARAAARAAATIKRELAAAPAGDRVTLPAAVLAAALRQVRGAAATDPEFPVLTGIQLEATAASLTLTATDRYRLTTRSVVPRQSHGTDWSLVLDTRELDPIIDWLDTLDYIVAAPTDHGLLLSADEQRCYAVLDERFPDYRAMLGALAPARQRVLTARGALLAALESSAATVRFEASAAALTISDEHGAVRGLPAESIGPDLGLTFATATLRPAIQSALGPDLMFDIAAADQPVVVRSATDGDLTTLVMPTRPNTPPEGTP
ncbi:MerR family transcriptional regulator [Nocardia brasiliensis]|uniref:MerR family transcriptional regulator n=1 Tax=Nocardia brasiliensis TaxID=37326 RepID=A0A6G9XW81_NOCBR|nr:MerR family transcriptional regulator [Nocardia brasiliensis]QIS05175.1 MerR family transcriptional regulator [Nocardia brasiliensis]